MKQSVIVQKIEDFISSEFRTQAQIKVEPTMDGFLNGESIKRGDEVTIRFFIDE